MFDPRLKHAVAVGRLGSFSRAADAVGVTQSAVTKSVADLERSLGFALFHRTSRGALPTEEGRDFIDRAARILADAAELMGEAERRADPYKGPLRIGLFPGSMDWLLTEPLIALIRRHPAVRIEILTGNSERGVQLLSRGDIDVAFGLHAAFGAWSQCRCETIASAEIVPFVRQDHPILAHHPIGEDMLIRYDFVVPSSSEPYTSIIQEMFERHGQRPSDRLHMTDHFPLMRRIVASSDAIGLIAREFARTTRFRERFTVLNEVKVLEPLVMCYAVRTRWPVKPAARALIAEVRHVRARVAALLRNAAETGQPRSIG